MKALIVVDVQNDFCPGGALAVPEGDAVIPVVNRLMAEGGFDFIVATQDWHPAGHASFASEHPGRAPGQLIDLDGLQQVLWPDHCVQESRGAEFPIALDTQRFDAVFHKGTDPRVDSYSGFFDNGRKHSTGLDVWLKDRQVDQVFVCGLATDYCVKFTALDAADVGLDTTVVVDACRGVNLEAGDSAAALRELREAGVKTEHSDTIFGTLPHE